MDRDTKIIIGCVGGLGCLILLFYCNMVRRAFLLSSHSNDRVNQIENENVPPPLSHHDHPSEYFAESSPSYEYVMAHPELYLPNSLPTYEQVSENQGTELQGAQNTRVLGPPLRETDV